MFIITEMILFNIPAVKEDNMDNGGSETSKAESIGHSKECAEIETSFFLIRIQVNVKV